MPGSIRLSLTPLVLTLYFFTARFDRWALINGGGSAPALYEVRFSCITLFRALIDRLRVP